MTVADKITLSRIIVAPFFFFVLKAQFIPRQPAIVALWIMFCWMEVSDLIDGKIARANDQVTPFGKLFDPFADVISRVTYFVAFTSIGIMPLWVLLVVLYREFGILFLRMLLGLKGITMGARTGGKLKAGIYMVAGLFSLILYTVLVYGGADVSGPISLSGAGGLADALGLLTRIAYILAAVATIVSFIDYLFQFRKLYR
jgi:CDP-diacylglycerol--glycerol-3-phosphate 3-phosphatidyltransferase